MKHDLSIGDTIRDVEDGECYYEGVVVSTNPIKYKVTNIVWNGEIDTSHNGKIFFLHWWYVVVLKDGEFVLQKETKQ